MYLYKKVLFNLEKKYEIFLDKIKCLDVLILTKEPMKNHTTFKIGGSVDFFVTVNTLKSLIEFLKIIKKLEIPYYVLGNGSNILVSDEGLRGVVIKLGKEFKNIEILDSLPPLSSDVLIKCGSAVLNSSLCLFAKNNGLSGLEFLYGIPGTVGGAVYMNAGAYLSEIKNVILYSECVSKENKILKLYKDDMQLRYRSSIYHQTKNIIVSAVFKLKKSDPKTVENTMKSCFFKRKSSQPLNFPNAGSIFKKTKNSNYSAGALIDSLGLKGTSVGDAVVSFKHAGFIVNKGNAKCTDVLKLISLIKNNVKENYKTNLETEIEIWN